MKYAFALTGGIATGKSTLCKMLQHKGFEVVDLDKITHEILSQRAKDIKRLFGENFVKQEEVDTKALGNLIFANKKAKKKLEDFIHPLIRQKTEQKTEKLDRLKKPYLVDIPLFFEKQGVYDIKNSILVYAPKQIQLQRLMERSNLSLEEANLRISSQMDIEEKKALATYVLDNSKSIDELPKKVEKLTKWIKEKHASIKI